MGTKTCPESTVGTAYDIEVCRCRELFRMINPITGVAEMCIFTNNEGI